MILRFIASSVIAALLLTGAGTAAPRTEKTVKPAARPVAIAQTTESAPTEALLTRQQAIDVALAHAQLSDVTHLEAEFHKQDKDWEVEFRYGDCEYDYTICAATGKVMKWEKDYDPPKATQPKPTEPAPTIPAPTEPAPPAALTGQEALALALQHAGLTQDQIRKPEWEKDRERGVPVFEVEFDFGSWEYDYVIHAETGEVLHWEKEWDD